MIPLSLYTVTLLVSLIVVPYTIVCNTLFGRPNDITILRLVTAIGVFFAIQFTLFSINGLIPRTTTSETLTITHVATNTTTHKTTITATTDDNENMTISNKKNKDIYNALVDADIYNELSDATSGDVIEVTYTHVDACTIMYGFIYVPESDSVSVSGTAITNPSSNNDTTIIP